MTTQSSFCGCGEQLVASDDRFCRSCGTPLNETSADYASTAEPPKSVDWNKIRKTGNPVRTPLKHGALQCPICAVTWKPGVSLAEHKRLIHTSLNDAPVSVDLGQRVRRTGFVQTRADLAWSVVIIAAVVVLIVALGAWIASSSSTGYTPSHGDEVLIRRDGASTLAVARDIDTWNDLGDALIAKDEVGYAELFLTDRAFRIGNNTRALVLDVHFTRTRVRIQSGDHQGQVGWVAREWVEKR